MAEEDTRKWCWRCPNKEVAYGPFATMQAALADAVEYDDPPPEKILVGRCEYGRATNYIQSMDTVLEDIEQCAYDNDFDFKDDGHIFDVEPGAEEAYQEAMEEWANKYLSCSIWYCDSEKEMFLVGTNYESKDQ